MDIANADILSALNRRFYEREASSFSQTRHEAWAGWRELMARALADPSFPSDPHVVDLACGNLRFERFLLESFPERRWSFVAVDQSLPLMEEGIATEDSLARSCRLQELDLIGLLSGTAEPDELGAQASTRFDLACCFGFFHHLPLARWRAQMLELMLECVKPGGLLALSLWQFLEDPTLAKRAERVHAPAVKELAAREGLEPEALAPGDRILGWQGKPGAWRYCHSFSDEEVSALIDQLAGRCALVADLRADGPSARSNRYLLLKRLPGSGPCASWSDAQGADHS